MQLQACIFSAWLPQSVHDRAHIALRALLPKNGSLFEPRQDVVIIFKQVLCCQGALTAVQRILGDQLWCLPCMYPISAPAFDLHNL